jgi:hypothetical protein
VDDGGVVVVDRWVVLFWWGVREWMNEFMMAMHCVELEAGLKWSASSWRFR